jgi:hypothetical protein
MRQSYPHARMEIFGDTHECRKYLEYRRAFRRTFFFMVCILQRYRPILTILGSVTLPKRFDGGQKNYSLAALCRSI